MKLTVLVDNNTYIDAYYLGEPAVSYYIEEGGKKFLFDLGYSDVYVQNAAKMKIDLLALDAVILSHGHDDHTGGLASFPKGETPCKLIAHPDVFEEKRSETLAICSPLRTEEAAQLFDLALSKEPVQLTENLWFLGEVARSNTFENQSPIGQRRVGVDWMPDMLADDTALAYTTADGVYIITGCSHAGICNIVEYAKQVTGKQKVLGIIGGFHLFDADSEQAKETVSYLKGQAVPQLFPCHCTSFAARAAIHSEAPIQEVGVGLTLTW